MERERMRRVLAEGMGWTDKDGVWHDANGQCVQNGCGHAQMVVYWDPIKNWRHAGQVIEAMRAKGWEFAMSWDNSDAVAIFGQDQGGARNEYDAMVEGATLAGVCYAICTAACRALESEATE